MFRLVEFEVSNQMLKNFCRALASVLILLFVTSTFQVPAVNCRVSNVLEEFQLEQSSTNCDDKTVCELNCKDFIPTCNHHTFLDLTDLLKKDKNYQIAYQTSCVGMISGKYLNDKLSLYFRSMVGQMTNYTQEWYFNTQYIKRIPFAKKYKNLYKTSIEVIKKLPEFKKDVGYVSDMIMFEYTYVQDVAHNSKGPMQSTLWALYYYSRSLSVLKKLCKKNFLELKNKSLSSVVNMIETEVFKEVRAARVVNGQCEGFCWYWKNYYDLGNQLDWKKYVLRLAGYLRHFYAVNLAKSLISGKYVENRNYCKCKKISKLDGFLKDKSKSFDHVRDRFPKGYTVAPFEKYIKSFCQSKCGNAKKDDEDEDEEGDE
jgi:hypothetical protein